MFLDKAGFYYFGYRMFLVFIQGTSYFSWKGFWHQFSPDLHQQDIWTPQSSLSYLHVGTEWIPCVKKVHKDI